MIHQINEERSKQKYENVSIYISTTLLINLIKQKFTEIEKYQFTPIYEFNGLCFTLNS